MTTNQTCRRCGALVGDEETHLVWHQHLDDVEAMALDGVEKAEDAQNTLYQNNIQV